MITIGDKTTRTNTNNHNRFSNAKTLPSLKISVNPAPRTFSLMPDVCSMMRSGEDTLPEA